MEKITLGLRHQRQNLPIFMLMPGVQNAKCFDTKIILHCIVLKSKFEFSTCACRYVKIGWKNDQVCVQKWTENVSSFLAEIMHNLQFHYMNIFSTKFKKSTFLQCSEFELIYNFRFRILVSWYLKYNVYRVKQKNVPSRFFTFWKYYNFLALFTKLTDFSRDCNL